MDYNGKLLDETWTEEERQSLHKESHEITEGRMSNFWGPQIEVLRQLEVYREGCEEILPTLQTVCYYRNDMGVLGFLPTIYAKKESPPNTLKLI